MGPKGSQSVEMPSEFSEGQIALIEKIAFRVGDVIVGRIKEAQATAIQLHAATCDAKVELSGIHRSIKYLLVGVCIGGILVGGGGAIGLLKLLSVF